MQMVEEGRKVIYEISTGLFPRLECHNLVPCAKPSPYLEGYFAGVTGDSDTVGVVFLTCHMDLLMEYLAMSSFFFSVLEFFCPLLYELPFCYGHSGSFGNTSTYSTMFDSW
jgi:hypothetical protein